MRNFLLVCVILSGSFAWADSKCSNISTSAGKMEVFSNGLIVIDKYKLPTQKNKTDWETGSYTKNLFDPDKPQLTTDFKIKRNAKNQPTEIQATMGAGSYGGGMPIGMGQSPFIDKYQFNYDKDGMCELTRITTNNVVKYDVSLCNDLSNQFVGIDKDKIEMCNSIISRMAATIKKFKESIKSEHLELGEDIAKNPYQDALLRSAECRKFLSGQEDKLNSLSIPQSGTAKTK